MSRRDGKKEFDVPKWFDLPEITPSSRKRAGSAAVQEPEQQQLNWKPMTASRLDRKDLDPRHEVLTSTPKMQYRKRYGTAETPKRKISSRQGTGRKQLPELDKFGLWPIQKLSRVHRESCDLELDSTQPLVEARNNLVEESPQPVARETVERRKTKYIKCRDIPLGLTKKTEVVDEVKPEVLPVPKSRNRKEMKELHSIAFKQLQKKLYYKWKFIEIGFKQNEISLAELRQLLSISAINLNEFEIQHIFQVIAHSTGYSKQSFADDTIRMTRETFKIVIYPDLMDINQWEMEAEAKRVKLEELERKNEAIRQQIDHEARERLGKLVAILRQEMLDFNINTVWSSESVGEKARQELFDLVMKPVGIPWSTLIYRKNFSLIELRRQTELFFATHGHLEDIPLDTAAHVVHDCASLVLQRWCRHLKHCAEMEKTAERKALRRFQFRNNHFFAWQDLTTHLHAFYTNGFRHFIAWKHFWLRNKQKRTYTRICFRPFFVWSRTARSKTNAKRKAFFLKNLLHTYTLLINFRAFRTRIERKKYYRRMVQECKRSKANFLLQQVLRTWRSQVERQIQVMTSIQLGAKLHENFASSMIKTSLYMWRYWTILQCQTARRCRQFYYNVLSGENPLHLDGFDLPRFRDTSLVKKVQLKSIIYTLSTELYLRAKEHDRLALISAAVFFKRYMPRVLKIFRRNTIWKRKNRFALYLGALRRKQMFFQSWVRVVLYQTEDPVEECQENEENIGSTTIDAGILDWKNDFQWRAQGIQKAIETQAELVVYLSKVKAKRLDRIDTNVRRNQQVKQTIRMEGQFLNEQTQAIQEIKCRAQVFGAQMVRQRGREMHDALVHVMTELEEKQYLPFLRSMFRRLRHPVSMRQSIIVGNQSRIRNWLRLAKRFQLLSREIDTFRQYWIKQKVLRAWLTFLQVKYKYETPGLSIEIRSRRNLMKKYHEYLEEQDAINSDAFRPTESCELEFRAVFLRWVYSTQLIRIQSKLIQTFRRRSNDRLKSRIFLVLKIRLKPKYHPVSSTMSHYDCICASADLEYLRSRCIVYSKVLLPYRLKRLFQWIIRRVRRRARLTPNLKDLFQQYEASIDERLFYENRLMFTAFNERHIHHYQDRISSVIGTGSGSAYFEDQRPPPYGTIREIQIISSTKIDGIETLLSTGVRNELHGNYYGQTEVFKLGKKEDLTRVEGFYSNETIFALRFETSKDRWSKWYGNTLSISHATKSFYFQAEEHESIVGFIGNGDELTLHGLGVIIRKTLSFNVFAGLWPSDTEESHREFSYFLQLRAGYIRKTQQRCARMIFRAWRSRRIPPELCNLRILMSIGKWTLTAWTHGLVQVPEEQTTRKYATELSRYMNIQEASDDLQEYNAATDKIYQLRQISPQLPVHDAMVSHVLKLYQIVQTRKSIEQAGQAHVFLQSKNDFFDTVDEMNQDIVTASDLMTDQIKTSLSSDFCDSFVNQ